MWSTSCNIQHVAQLQSQLKIQWSILWKIAFRHLWLANTTNPQSIPHHDVVKWSAARATRSQEVAEPWEHCTARDLKRCSQQRQDEKCNFDGSKGKRNGSRSMWIEWLLWQENENMTQRQRLDNSRKKWDMLERQDRHPKSAKKTLQEVSNAIGHSLSDLASSDSKEHGKVKENDHVTELGKLSKDDEPGWVMSTITKTVQHRNESFRQKKMWLEELMQPRWVDAAGNFCERDKNYRTAELKVPAVANPQTDSFAATPSLTTFGLLMQTLDIIPRQAQMLQGTSWAGSCQMRLGAEKPH